MNAHEQVTSCLKDLQLHIISQTVSDRSFDAADFLIRSLAMTTAFINRQKLDADFSEFISEAIAHQQTEKKNNG